jgi:hypothetical protein
VPELRVVPELGDPRQRLCQRRCSGDAKNVVIEERDRVGVDGSVGSGSKIGPREMAGTLELDEIFRRWGCVVHAARAAERRRDPDIERPTLIHHRRRQSA